MSTLAYMQTLTGYLYQDATSEEVAQLNAQLSVTSRIDLGAALSCHEVGSTQPGKAKANGGKRTLVA